MTPRLALVLLVAVLLAEIVLRFSQWLDEIGRAVTLPCPCGDHA